MTAALGYQSPRTSPPLPRAHAFKRALTNQQAVLTLLIAAELVLFSISGTNFLSVGNLFTTIRLSLEVGLLAVALTPVIVTGGIDLSVGSLMGLSAIILGKLWRDAHWPIGAAVAGTLGVGALAGLMNGLMITRLRIPPLIVTLGSFSLFRGLAEGITRAIDNFTGFPQSFLDLGKDASQGHVPRQLVIFVIVAAAFWVLLHRTTFGRGLVAIGFAPEGARYAGIPVERRITLVYVLSGLIASLAAVIYVARVGQAKADAGTNYELIAITAVVLGGTSIFGGRGSVVGTLLGWLAIAILEPGLTLSDWPKELAKIITGLFLIIAIVVNQALAAHARRHRPGATDPAFAPATPEPPDSGRTAAADAFTAAAQTTSTSTRSAP